MLTCYSSCTSAMSVLPTTMYWIMSWQDFKRHTRCIWQHTSGRLVVYNLPHQLPNTNLRTLDVSLCWKIMDMAYITVAPGRSANQYSYCRCGSNYALCYVCWLILQCHAGPNVSSTFRCSSANKVRLLEAPSVCRKPSLTLTSARWQQ